MLLFVESFFDAQQTELLHNRALMGSKSEIYGFSAGKLNELLFVRNEAFLRSFADDSDIWISLTTDFGGAFDLALLISGVMPKMTLWRELLLRNAYLYVKAHLLESTLLFDKIIDGIARNPEH